MIARGRDVRGHVAHGAAPAAAAPRRPDARPLGAFGDARRAAGALAQVVELGAPDHAARDDLDAIDRAGECTGKVRSTPTPYEVLRTVNISRFGTALAADDRALEDLDTLLVALDHPDVHTHGVAGLELGTSFRSCSASIRSIGFMEPATFTDRCGVGQG